MNFCTALLNYNSYYIHFAIFSSMFEFSFCCIFIIVSHTCIVNHTPNLLHSEHFPPITCHNFISISDFFLGQKTWFFFGIRAFLT